MAARRDDGMALVPVVIGVAIFAYLALEVLDLNHASLALTRAETNQARLTAAADAGLASTIYALGLKDSDRRFQADGRSHVSYFDGVALTITAQEEHGKIAINRVGSDVERRLFAAAGIEGRRLDILVDAFDDWKDNDADARTNGAEYQYYVAYGYQPRNGAIRTLDEMAQIRGMDGDLFARIAPAITLFPSGGFDAKVAVPLALAAMQANGMGSFDVQRRQDQLAGDRPVLEITDRVSYVGSPISITVKAALPGGGRMVRTVVVELTGEKLHPYWIRYGQ